MDGKHNASHEAHVIPGLKEKKQYGFPNSIITKLRYSGYYTLSSTSGGRGLQIMNANSTFDPDSTGGGHQPLYRDQYAGIYDLYTVIGSKITTHWGTTSVPYLIGIVGDNDSTISSTIETLMEQNNSVYTTIGSNGAPTKTLEAFFEPLEMLGIDAKDDGTALTPVGSNPTDLYCFGVWAAPIDAASSTSIQVAVTIEYTVKFSQLNTQAQN